MAYSPCTRQLLEREAFPAIRPEVSGALGRSPAKSPASAGDFYLEPDDTVRGVVLDACTGHPSYFEPAKVEVIEPAEVPFGGLAATSIVVPMWCATAAEVAAVVEGLLREQLSAAILKANKQKLSMRAQARVVPFGSCELKVRVFRLPEDPRHGEPAYAVELQRRGAGGAFAFAAVFRQVAAFVASRFPAARAADGGALPTEAFFPPTAMPSVGQRCEEDFMPLVEMAANNANTEAQVEAIAALGTAASVCQVAAAVLSVVLVGGALDSLRCDPRKGVVASAELLAAELAAGSLRCA